MKISILCIFNITQKREQFTSCSHCLFCLSAPPELKRAGHGVLNPALASCPADPPVCSQRCPATKSGLRMIGFEHIDSPTSLLDASKKPPAAGPSSPGVELRSLRQEKAIFKVL